MLSSDHNGGSPTAYSYDEFGVPGTTGTPRFGYTGQAWVPEAGLYYYKARMYSPSLGNSAQGDAAGASLAAVGYVSSGVGPEARIAASRGLSSAGTLAALGALGTGAAFVSATTTTNDVIKDFNKCMAGEGE